jgi:hypothetical protein
MSDFVTKNDRSVRFEPIPLSWQHARQSIRNTLEGYLREQRPNSSQVAKPNEKYLSRWIRCDLDLYAGALPLSVALLILSVVSLLSRLGVVSNTTLKASASVPLYQAQVAASVLLLVGSGVSLWMLRMHNFLWINDTDNAKRREIRNFLRRLDRFQQRVADEVTESSNTGFKPDDTNISHPSEVITPDNAILNIDGTSLTDIYPVYRRTSNSEIAPAAWSRVPSLLLVKGDFVSLQIGDTAPAACQMTGKSANGKPVRVQAGDHITLQLAGETAENVISQLPQGRTTLPSDSAHLLTHCNGMRVFIVLETPIDQFIHRPAGTPTGFSVLVYKSLQPADPLFYFMFVARSRPSIILRKVTEIRKALTVAAVAMFAVTALVIFVRPGATKEDLSIILPLPLLAALGVLPVVGPAYILFLEMVGTARILAAVHPHAIASSGAKNDLRAFQKTGLLFRYLFATFLSRLALWQLFLRVSDSLLGRFFPIDLDKDSIVRVPPASLNLLEKLGVATAFAIVDDEIVCEPHSVPQQLLIPSAKGLKLLDLCIACDVDSDDETDNSDGEECMLNTCTLVAAFVHRLTMSRFP